MPDIATLSTIAIGLVCVGIGALILKKTSSAKQRKPRPRKTPVPNIPSSKDSNSKELSSIIEEIQQWHRPKTKTELAGTPPKRQD